MCLDYPNDLSRTKEALAKQIDTRWIAKLRCLAEHALCLVEGALAGIIRVIWCSNFSGFVEFIDP